MSTILNGFKEAFLLIFRFDSQFFGVLWLTIKVCGTAAVLGALIGIPLGASLSEFSFRGRKALLTLIHALMGFPPVVVGLITFLVLVRSGPLGSLRLIYTPTAMVIGQTILAIPIVAGFTYASMEGVDPRLGMQASSLGATRLQSIFVKLREARTGLVAAFIAGLGRVFAEVGAAIILGGNIKGKTRILTTDIVLQVSQGNYELAIAEGIVLIIMAVIVNALLTRLQVERGRREIDKRVTGYPA